jgi:murein DD-endopeptidase MepM/ murein hydrolase activator NlpD
MKLSHQHHQDINVSSYQLDLSDQTIDEGRRAFAKFGFGAGAFLFTGGALTEIARAAQPRGCPRRTGKFSTAYHPPHLGTDFVHERGGVPVDGAKVFAVAPGITVFGSRSRTVFNGVKGVSGNLVFLYHGVLGDGPHRGRHVFSHYSHLKEILNEFRPGGYPDTFVKRHEQIGVMGDTGNWPQLRGHKRYPHLHLGSPVSATGEYDTFNGGIRGSKQWVDPETFAFADPRANKIGAFPIFNPRKDYGDAGLTYQSLKSKTARMTGFTSPLDCA